MKWKKKPWVLSDFLVDQKKPLLISGTVINTRPNIDFERVAQSKSKKAKTVYTMMSQQLEITKQAENYAAGGNILGETIVASQFAKSQQVLEFGKGGGDMFGGGDEEEYNSAVTGPSATEQISQATIMASMQQEVDVAFANEATGGEGGQSQAAYYQEQAATAVYKEEKTIMELLEEREI